MRKKLAYLTSFFVALALYLPAYTVSAASLCEQFTPSDQQGRCESIYSTCSATPGNLDCEKAAASALIALQINEGCLSRGVPRDQCEIQFDAAQESSATCFTQAEDTVASCKGKAEAAAQNAATAAFDAVAAQQAQAEAEARARAAGNTAPSNQTQTIQTNVTRNQATGGGVLNYTPLEPLPGLENVQSGRLNFANLLESFFTILISIGGLLAVLMLIIGGITYMVSDVVHKKTAALKRIQAAIWGILLLVASWLILNTINPQLLTFSALIRPAPPPSASGLNTVPSNTGSDLTLDDNDPQRDTKLQNWCSGVPEPVGTQVDDYSRYTRYICTPG